MTQTFTVMASLIALVFGLTTFFAISATAGEPEAQKTLFVSHELAFLLRTQAFLPENSNYLLPDSLEGATAELLQRRLIVQGATTRTPPLILPEFIKTQDTKVNVDFLYVTKTGDSVGLSSIRSDVCLKIDTNGIKNSKLKLTTEFFNEEQEKILKPIKENIMDRLDRIHSVEEGGSLQINLFISDREEILLGAGVNREHSSLSCFIKKNTGFEIYTSEDALSIVNIGITRNTDTNKLITDIVNSLEEYHE